MLYKIMNKGTIVLPEEYEKIEVFTSEKLKDIIANPSGKVGTKEQYKKFQDFLLEEITEEAKRGYRTKYYTGAAYDYTYRKQLLNMYNVVLKPIKITNYKDEVKYIQNIEWNLEQNL